MFVINVTCAHYSRHARQMPPSSYHATCINIEHMRSFSTGLRQRRLPPAAATRPFSPLKKERRRQYCTEHYAPLLATLPMPLLSMLRSAFTACSAPSVYASADTHCCHYSPVCPRHIIKNNGLPNSAIITTLSIPRQYGHHAARRMCQTRCIVVNTGFICYRHLIVISPSFTPPLRHAWPRPSISPLH